MGLAAGGVCAVGAVLRGVCRLRSASRCRLPACRYGLGLGSGGGDAGQQEQGAGGFVRTVQA